MEFAIALLLLVLAGWIVGVIGFFKALRALREVAQLRAALGAREEAAAARPVVSPWAMPPPPPAPMPETVPAPMPEAEPDAGPGAEPQPEPPPARPPRDLEALLTQRWGTWLGAAALLLAGVFLVRYAVEQGMLGPAVRCVLAGLLGLALLGAAEGLQRRPAGDEAKLGADQAPAALAAGGVAVLFGAAYGAGPLYDLVDPVVGFLLMGAAAVAGLGFALRFGKLVGAVGLVGAFAAPALVNAAAPYAPGLFGYLLMVTLAAQLVVRLTAWGWLGWAAIVGGAFWVGLAATGELGPDYWAAGLFVPAAAALHLGLLPAAALEARLGRLLAWVAFAALGTAGLLLVASLGDAWVRAGLLLLAPLAVWQGAARPVLARLPWLAALFFLLALLAWVLPHWQPTGEVVATEGLVQAVLPGAWAPEAILPLLQTAALMTAFFAASGLWLERRAARRLAWSGLAAGVPVLTLAVTYVQVGLFQPVMAWAFAALGLAGALVAAAWASGADRQRAGVHAAGAVAALALACAMLLSDQWLTLAVALFLPPLAWIEARAELPALRRVALVVAGLVLARLLLNWYVLDYDFGRTPLVNGLLLAYGVPAGCFGLAAWMFRRRGDDRCVAVLEAGAIAFATVLVALEIRHVSTGGRLDAPDSFTEVTLHVAALSAQATALLRLAQRTGRVVQAWAWRVEGALALGGALLLLAANPALTGDASGQVGLLAGYLVPGLLAGLAARRLAGQLAAALGGYAVLAGFVFLGLEVRLLYHPQALGLEAARIADAELWAWSGAWLAYGAGLMALGMATRMRAVRLAALGIIGLVAAKAFLVDMAGLEGLWRVLSFLGLGLALIGLGAAYRRFGGRK